MSDENNKKPSIFDKVLEMGTAMIDAQIVKAKSSVMNQNLDEDFFYSKAVTEDPSYQVYSAGWKEKPARLQDSHLRQMSINNSVIAAVIQTQQNQVARHSQLVKSEKECGWMLKLRDEEALLEKIKEELQLEEEAEKLAVAEGQMDTMGEAGAEPAPEDMMGGDMTKAEGDPAPAVASDDAVADDAQLEESTGESDTAGMGDDEAEEYNFELERKAKQKLEEQFKDARKKVQDYIINCGIVENRPFETKKWNFDAALRAWTRDSLTYDKYATEMVPDRAGRVHHFFPVDGATIKFASNRLADYKQLAENFINLDILYPENKVEAIEKQKVLDLKDDLIAKNAYKYVQVVRGKIERAYTEDELKLGIRNVTTDIYANGYGVAELELVVSLVTGHLNAEFYNQAYFTQGFSAKGILHIKAPLNRRKVETVRQQWQHMLKGARNSFQTPIFAGMEDVAWIPLTQNHNDIGFEGWMRYLIKMICAIYQIDPHEIGIGFKDEGAGSGGMSGDNTKEKLEQSKNKGLYPLLRHIENYLNEQIIKPFDSRFILKFCGVTTESKEDAVKRQDLERKFKKTVNEIRDEDGLPPLPGMDDFIAGPEYASWYGQFSKKAEDQAAQAQQAAADAAAAQGGADGGDGEDDSFYGNDLEANLIKPEQAEVPGEPKPSKAVNKALAIRKAALRKAMAQKKKPRRVKVEYYKIGK